MRATPDEAVEVEVDLDGLREVLGVGQRRGVGAERVVLTSPDGVDVAFRVQPTDVMAPSLAKKHPEIKTYVGRAVDDARVRVALTLAPTGLNASVTGPGADWLVVPTYVGRKDGAHVTYDTADAPQGEPLLERSTEQLERVVERAAADPQAGEDVPLRIYRLALLNDPTYAEYFGSENVLAEKAALVNRVNQVYDTDLGIQLQLIAETEQLNLDTEAAATGENGPCGSAPCFQPGGELEFCSVSTLGRTRAVLGQLVGRSAYDIGHLVLGTDGGGIAYIGVAGYDYAGGGCTGLPEPTGDFFYIDYVAHEIGHQLSAEHTFDGTLGACFNDSLDSAVEPGSGSSVMAYAGICGRDNLQDHSDPVFSQHTIEQISGFTSGARQDVIEVQQVALRDFDTDGQTLTIGFGGATVTVTRGEDYDAAGLDEALDTLVGDDVVIAGWGFDPYSGGGDRDPSDAGFQVIFAETSSPDVRGDYEDQPLLTVAADGGASAEVGEVSRGGPSGNRGTVIESGNRRPEVSAGNDKTIPALTPFKLRGRGEDPDGDELTWSWEQDDAGVGTRLLSNEKTRGPLFRIFGDNAEVTSAGALESPSPGQNSPTTDPVRFFPDLQQVLDGRTNIGNGTCPSVTGFPNDRQLDCYSEFLPTRDYRGGALNFRVTARDGVLAGGGSSYDDVRLKLDTKAGPFLVTSQSKERTLGAGSATHVYWDPNRTRKYAKNVKIKLTPDGGETWVKLSNRTRNDGKQRVKIPRRLAGSEDVRIMVQSRGNYFYAVNEAWLAIG